MTTIDEQGGQWAASIAKDLDREYSRRDALDGRSSKATGLTTVSLAVSDMPVEPGVHVLVLPEAEGRPMSAEFKAARGRLPFANLRAWGGGGRDLCEPHRVESVIDVRHRGCLNVP